MFCPKCLELMYQFFVILCGSFLGPHIPALLEKSPESKNSGNILWGHCQKWNLVSIFLSVLTTPLQKDGFVRPSLTQYITSTKLSELSVKIYWGGVGQVKNIMRWLPSYFSSHGNQKWSKSSYHCTALLMSFRTLLFGFGSHPTTVYFRMRVQGSVLDANALFSVTMAISNVIKFSGCCRC